MGTTIIAVILVVYFGFWSMISYNFSGPFSDAINLITGPWPDPDDFTTFLGGTDVFAWVGAIIWNALERVANIWIALAALIAPWEISMYGQTANTGALTAINFFVLGIGFIMFKDEVLKIIGAVSPL